MYYGEKGYADIRVSNMREIHFLRVLSECEPQMNKTNYSNNGKYVIQYEETENDFRRLKIKGKGRK